MGLGSPTAGYVGTTAVVGAPDVVALLLTPHQNSANPVDHQTIGALNLRRVVWGWSGRQVTDVAACMLI